MPTNGAPRPSTCSPATPDAASASPPRSDDAAGPDMVLVHGRTDDGSGLRVLRARRGRIEAGEVRPLADGVPIRGEVVRLKPREDAPAICDVEVTFSPASLESAKGAPPRDDGRQKGPVRIASRAYRDNWETIFQRNEQSGRNESN